MKLFNYALMQIRKLFLITAIATSMFSTLGSFAHASNEVPEVVKKGALRLKDFGLKAQVPFVIYNYDENLVYFLKLAANDEIQVLDIYVSSGGRGGISNVFKTGGTPPGVHRIYRKQGHDFAPGQTFDAGKYGYYETVVTPTQGLQFWKSDFVTTRILRLVGLEGSKNNNSVARSILIHGTNSEGLLGYHESAGCIRMTNLEVIELFNQVEEGTLVNIVYETGAKKRVPADQKLYVDESKVPELRRIGRRSALNESRSRVNFLGGGDIIFHGALHIQAMIEKRGFGFFFEPIQPLMAQADVVYGNLEGPSAFQVNDRGQIVTGQVGVGYKLEEDVYSPGTQGKSMLFNFHPDSVKTLQNIGFSILSLANNHSFDRGVNGINRTLDLMDELQLPSYGMRKKGEARSWSYVIEKDGIKMGFVGCTTFVNGGKPAPDQILYCDEASGKVSSTLISEIRNLTQNTDIVIFTPHWGNEYQLQPDATQKRIAKAALDAGARVILGSHPHVLQPVEVNKVGDIVESIVAYSLGNLVTNQMPTDWNNNPAKFEEQFKQRVSALIAFSLFRENGEIVLTAPQFIPTYMSPTHFQPEKARKLLLAYSDIYEAADPKLKAHIVKAGPLLNSQLGANRIVPLDNLEDIFGAMDI
jgi:poly-gamma-glutamate synthesis protein (capsule biosynthesis protein)